ncbi:MAG: glycoside hydrolase, partial [Vicinamibacterales bacterium]
RVRWNMNTDTPLPPDEPTGENPPDGAMIDYLLPAPVSGPVTLEIKDDKGRLVRRYTSEEQPSLPDPKDVKVPYYWLRPPQALSAQPGLHRFLWDMHYAPIAGVEPQYPIAAIYRETAAEPTAPWALPGSYTVTLTADGKSQTQTLTLKMDPRVKASAADLAAQFDLSLKLYELRKKLEPIGKRFDALVAGLAKAKDRAGDGPLTGQIEALQKQLEQLSPPNARPGTPLQFAALANVQQLFGTIQHVDAAPTPRVRAAVPEVERQATEAIARWEVLLANEVAKLNEQLTAAGQPPIDLATAE